MINKLKNEKGSFAIISAILIFIVVLCVAGYQDMIQKRWVINEVQAVMDASGTNTLKETVDMDYLRAEILATDGNNKADTSTKQIKTTDYKNKIKSAYIKEMKSQISTNQTIDALDVQTVNVYFEYDSFGLGESSKARPQITLESVSKIRVNSYEFMDGLEGMSRDIYSSRNNETFTVTYNGKTNDGKTELIIYSATRLVYR